MSSRPGLGAWLAVAALVSATVTAAPIPPGRLAVLDSFADPFARGHFGAIFEAVPLAPPGTNATALASSADLYYALDLQFLADGSLVMVDRDADPSGFGQDPNGGNGHGAVFLAAAADQAISVLSDGADYPAGIPPPLLSIFVEPYGVAVASSGDVLVADVDADPSGLGPDPAGFSGRGALFTVDPATGAVRTTSDGALSADGPAPGGAPSWFEDPGAVAVTPDGSAYVVDITADPLGTGGRGVVFRVDLATGQVRVVAASAAFRALTDVVALPDGSLVVVDQVADPRGDGSSGALFRIDPTAGDPAAAVTLLLTDPRFRALGGLDVAADGSLFVADSLANPFGAGGLGAIFRVRPDGSVSVASATADYRSVVSVQVARPTGPSPTLASVAPPSLGQGDTVMLTLTGGGFVATPEVALGPGLTVQAVRHLSPTVLEVDVLAAGDAPEGPRDVRLTNPDLQAALLPAGLRVDARVRPRVDSVVPGAAAPGDTLSVTLRGGDFADGATADFGSGIGVDLLTFRSGTELVADLSLQAGAVLGPRDVTVRNPDGETGTLVDGFVVALPAPPLVRAVVPPSAAPGQRLELQLMGENFAPGMGLDLGPGIQVGPVDVGTPTEARVVVAIAPGATGGPRDVSATNPDGQVGVLVAGFAVGDVPVLRVATWVIDDSGAQGNGNSSLDPGETIGIDLTLRNAGASDAMGVAVRIAAVSPGLSVVRAGVGFNDVPAGATIRRGAPPFPEVVLASEAACPATAHVDVEVLVQGQVVDVARLDLAVGRAATWRRKPVVEGAEVGGRRGAAVALADVDGDGVADLIIGAPGEEPAGLLAAGRVVALSGLTDDPLWSLDGTEAGGQLGAALAGVGDVTGDGAEDLVVGAPGSGANAGKAVLVSGLDGSVIRELPGVASSRLGTAVARAGDRDLDGRQEILLGAPSAGSGAGLVLLVTPELVELDRLAGVAGARLGAALAYLGDVDADGLEDVALGQPAAGGTGGVLLWGGDATVRTVSGFELGEDMGAALASGADVNADGTWDLIVGAPGASPGGLAGAGRAVVLDPRTLSAVREVRGSAAGDELGASVALLPDVDGDGSADVLVGAPGFAAEDGSVELRSGATGELLLLARGPASDRARLGASLAGGREAGGDAFPDWLAGAPRASTVTTPQTGHAAAFKSDSACDPFVPCAADVLEPNDLVASSSPLDYGRVAGLSICRTDVDVFQLQPALDRHIVVRVLFRHADGDLDATLHDASGALIDAALSLDDDEEVGPFGPGGGPYHVRVTGFEGAANTYDVVVLDPDSCPPTREVAGLRVAKTTLPGRTLLTWLPSVDSCHVTTPGALAYRVFAASTAWPTPGAGPFPGGSAFTDVTSADADGDLSGPSRWDDTSLAPRYWLVADVGRAGETGPAGWSSAP